MVKSLVEELQSLIQSEANNYPPPQQCTITRVYADGHVDVKTDIGVLVYVDCIGKAIMDDTGLLIYLNEERTQYVCLCINLTPLMEKLEDLEHRVVQNLGLPLFHIDADGYLIASYGFLQENIFQLNNDGELVVTLPTGEDNPFWINANGEIICTME